MTTLRCPCGRDFEARVSHGFIQIRCKLWPECERSELHIQRIFASSNKRRIGYLLRELRS